MPLSFDGFRLSWKSPEWQVDGFATRPVQNEPGVFDDPRQHDFAFWGFYATHPLHQTQRKVFDFYYLGSDLKHAVFNQGAGHEKRQTLGARIWGERGEFYGRSWLSQRPLDTFEDSVAQYQQESLQGSVGNLRILT